MEQQYQTALECVERMIAYLKQRGEHNAAYLCLVSAHHTKLFPVADLNKLAERYGIEVR